MILSSQKKPANAVNWKNFTYIVWRANVVCAAGSPFKVHITDQVNPQRVHCYGPGIDPKGVRKGQPALFTVDATQAGIAPLEVTTTDQRGPFGCLLLRELLQVA